jgi:hypothetical protein
VEKTPGLLQLDITLGYRARPWMAPWEAQGVDSIARPWPQVGPLITEKDFTLDFAHLQGTCPGGQSVPIGPSKPASCLLLCNACALRAQCTKAMLGQGGSLLIRADELFQQKLRAKMQTRRERASLRKRTAVEHTITHP